jgi:hypothetical protein
MYNVKRIGVWEYETKMSRDWLPPHWDEGYIRKGRVRMGQSSATWDPRWTFLSERREPSK